ncbi:MAG: hypothetical protein OQL28_06645 [Sedimenticola sp.]|nr:hypothetical protein [Sedimenticola sp.]
MKTKTPRIVQSRSRAIYLWLLIPLLLLVLLALLGWGDHIQFRKPPVDRVAPLQETLAGQSRRIVLLEEERRQLREQLAAREHASRMDQEAIRQVREELRQSQLRYQEMEKELGLLRDVVESSATTPGLYIQGFRVDSVGDDRRYRFRFTVSQALKNTGYAEGWIRLALEGDSAGQREILPLKMLTDGEHEKLKMRFRHFQDVDGVIQVPEAFVPERVIVEIETTNDRLPGVKKAFDWLVIR